jgi:mannose-6-phosphate isomerase-like protein (cupin superfamily)
MTESENPTQENRGEVRERFWGKVTVLEEGSRYRINHIEIKPGHTMTTQIHYHRSEHWVVVSGTAKVTCGEEELLVPQNSSTYVPQCTPHRVENPGVIPLVLIEIQNGEYLGEDDIIRLPEEEDVAADSRVGEDSANPPAQMG